jgi:hypothetical protein
MQIVKRLFRRNPEGPRPGTSEAAQTSAEQNAANRYWKAEVSADRQRRGKPDKRK